MIRPEHAQRPVVVANVITFFVMLGITIWACSKGGAGPLIHQGTSTTALPRSWAWFYGITSGVGGISSGILNQADYTRFARRQGRQVPGTVFALFVPGVIVPLFGILTASATVNIYKSEPYWNPLAIIFQWMTDSYSAGSRAAAFFCSFGFLLSQLAENILSNGYAAGMDMAGLFPKWVNIRRGCAIAALLSWAVQPWLFYNTSSVFVATMASFSVFLAPLTGIMMCDYFVLRRQRIELSHLYTDSKEGAYWYNFGINWRAVVAWMVVFTPALPGMIATLDTTVTINLGALNYYRGNYIFGGFKSTCIIALANPPLQGFLRAQFYTSS
jgi:nucleobase:cation symporter-1, NCS1 family